MKEDSFEETAMAPPEECASETVAEPIVNAAPNEITSEVAILPELAEDHLSFEAPLEEDEFEEDEFEETTETATEADASVPISETSESTDPALPEPDGFSYPSSHAALSVIYCEILCQFDPADEMDFMATAKLIGTDRVLGGVHYPSDVDSGRRFGQAWVNDWLDQPEHLKLLQTACSEWRHK